MNKWDSKRIAFISILIAMSISFVIIGTRFAALSSFPNIKLSLAGLPIKIIGYIFGPIIGFIIGFVTDVISFIFIPTFYYPLYSIALGISGMVPGIVAIFFNYFYKKRSKKEILKKLFLRKSFLQMSIKLFELKNLPKQAKKNNKKYIKILKKIDKIESWTKEKSQLNFLLIVGLTILLIVMIFLNLIFILIPQQIINDAIENQKILQLISKKELFIMIITIEILICALTLIIFRLKSKNEKTFLQYTIIVVFVVITEYVNIPIIAYADLKSLKINFLTSIITSLASSVIKILFNLLIISFTIKIVLPLINKKTVNTY